MQLQETKGIKGIVTFTNFELACAEALEIDRILQNAHDLIPSVYFELVRRLHDLCAVRTFQYQNLVVLTGRSVFARILAGDTTYTGAINYGALGSGSTAVSSANTQLATEVKRKLYGTRTQTGAQANLDFYYSKSDTNGTYNEFGTFIDGTATVNTGQLYNRVLTGGWTKSASESMTVSLQVDINDA
jgi:hypothetical protein